MQTKVDFSKTHRTATNTHYFNDQNVKTNEVLLDNTA